MAKIFSTIDGKLLTNNNVEVPGWINDIAFETPKKSTLTLESNTHVLNSRTVLAERGNLTNNIREIKNTFNDKTLRTSAIAKLAGFLSGKRFVLGDVSSTDNHIDINVNFVDNPFNYRFAYNVEDGHIKQANMFTTEINGKIEEYPFSNAGIEDSFNDIKNVDVKKSVRVKQAAAKVSTMTRLEIVRRCKNQLRLAQEMIDKNIKEGNIVGSGSNSYSSVYDMQKLFPDLNDEYVPEMTHTAEFVDNHVSTDINEQKTDDRLAIESLNILRDAFEVNRVANVSREGNELFVTAEVVNNNVRNNLYCNFTLNNERVEKLNFVEFETGERMSIAQALNKLNSNIKVASYLNNKNARIAGGYVYDIPTIRKTIGSFVNVKDVYNLVDDLCRNKYASRLNTSTIASKYSLNELLKFANAKLLSDEQVSKIRADKAYFGCDNHFYSYETQDNDTRNKLASAESKAKFNALHEYIGRFFKNYNIKQLNNEQFAIIFNGDKQRKLVAQVEYDNNVIKNVVCKLHDKMVPIKSLRKKFAQSQLLKAYAKTNDYYDGKIIISSRMFKEKLGKLLSDEQINNVVTNLLDSGKITIASRTNANQYNYFSDISFDELIRTSSVLPDKTREKYILDISNKSKEYEFDRSYINDNDTRIVTAKLSIESAKAQLERVLPKDVICLACDGTDIKDNQVDFVVRCFNKTAGVARNLKMTMQRTGSELSNLQLFIGNTPVSLKEAFATSKLTSEVNKLRGGLAGKFMIKTSQLQRELEDLVDKKSVQAVIDSWEKLGLIKRTAQDTFVGEVSINNLLETANIVMYDDATRNNIRTAKKYFGDLQDFERVEINDSDTRNEDVNKQRMLYAAKVNSLFSKHFDNFTVTNIGKNKFIVKFAVNDKKHKLYAELKDNNIYCTIKGKQVLANKVADMFKQSKLLKAYVKTASVSKDRSVFTTKQFMTKLGGLLDNKTIIVLLDDLVDNGQLSKLTTDTYACPYGLDELLREVSVNPDETIGQCKLELADRQQDYTIDDAYIDDGDVRIVDVIITPADVKQQFIAYLPDNIQCIDMTDIDIDDNNATFNTRCFDKDKCNESCFDVTATFNQGRLTRVKFAQNGQETTLSDGIKMNVSSKKYQELYAKSEQKHSVVFDRHQLEDKLACIINLDNLDDVISNWEKLGKVKRISSTKYASDQTLVELINESNLLPYNDEDTQKQFKKASAIKDIIPHEQHMKDFGSKSIDNIGDVRSRKLFNKDKQTLLKRIANAKTKHYITENKANKLIDSINNITTESELANINADLNRYLK